jgi:hypothetical protein
MQIRIMGNKIQLHRSIYQKVERIKAFTADGKAVEAIKPGTGRAKLKMIDSFDKNLTAIPPKTKEKITDEEYKKVEQFFQKIQEKNQHKKIQETFLFMPENIRLLLDNLTVCSDKKVISNIVDSMHEFIKVSGVGKKKKYSPDKKNIGIKAKKATGRAVKKLDKPKRNNETQKEAARQNAIPVIKKILLEQPELSPHFISKELTAMEIPTISGTGSWQQKAVNSLMEKSIVDQAGK